MLKNVHYFSYTFSSLQTSCIECSLLNLSWQKSGQLISWDPECAPNKAFWKMANFLREHYQCTYCDITVTTYQKNRGGESARPEQASIK